MLQKVRFNNFTTVPDEDWTFARGVNVIIGENGLGKSHILKSIYALLKVQSAKDFANLNLEKAYADKLVGVLRPESIGRLVKRKQGRARCEIALSAGPRKSVTIGFASNAKSQVEVVRAPRDALDLPPVYLPTRELATLCPWFVSLYDNYHVEFEESWRDTVSLLGAPSIKGPRAGQVSRLLSPLEMAMGGKVVVDKTGRFYLDIAGEGRMEMPLVAEGMRKLAMLARLISTGVLLEQGYLFWDEPETNLNPKLIKVIAACIMRLAAEGIQVFIATHSLFLLRELEMLAVADEYRRSRSGIRYFGLQATESGVSLEQGDQIDDLGTIVLLDEELAQSDRFMESEIE